MMLYAARVLFICVGSLFVPIERCQAQNVTTHYSHHVPASANQTDNGKDARGFPTWEKLVIIACVFLACIGLLGLTVVVLAFCRRMAVSQGALVVQDPAAVVQPPPAVAVVVVVNLPAHVPPAMIAAAVRQKQHCSITWDEITCDNACVTTCGHVFTEHGISQWMQHETTCPECRQQCRVNGSTLSPVAGAGAIGGLGNAPPADVTRDGFRASGGSAYGGPSAGRTFELNRGRFEDRWSSRYRYASRNHYGHMDEPFLGRH